MSITVTTLVVLPALLAIGLAKVATFDGDREVRRISDFAVGIAIASLFVTAVKVNL